MFTNNCGRVSGMAWHLFRGFDAFLYLLEFIESMILSIVGAIKEFTLSLENRTDF